jgi:repressor LexA
MKTLSTKQQRVMDYVKNFISKRGYAPSVRDIAAGCHIKSPAVAQYYLNILERDGYINRNKRITRSITLTSERSILPTVPLLGLIAAGDPIPVPNDNTWTLIPDEAVEVPSSILAGYTDVFALKVKGTSMIDALIDDGDTVLLTRASTAPDGSMVAVWLRDRNEVTLKKLYREADRIRLQPANRLMSPIFCRPEDVEVQGRIIGIMRKTD